jgi:protein TonB
MNKNSILKSDILDIVFDNRNKEYGAYNLRKFYPGRIKIALGIMFVFAFLFSAFTMLPTKETSSRIIYHPIEEPRFVNILEVPKQPEIKQPELKKPDALPQPKVQPVNANKYVSKIDIIDNKEKTDILKTLTPDKQIGSVNVDVPDAAPVLVNPLVKHAVVGGGDVITTPKVDKITPIDGDVVEVMPAYPGGMNALVKFLQKNLQTPDEIQNGEIVNVRIKFVVGYNGKLQSFVTVLDGGDAYNKEVMRVLKKMPDWIPGKSKGENVSVFYTIPVKFVSED